MRYLKSYKLFETTEHTELTDDVWNDISDILLELQDDCYQIHKDVADVLKVSNKLCDDVITIAILHGTSYEFNYSNIEEVLKRLIDYMTEKGWQYSIKCKTRGGIGIQSYTEIECNGKVLAEKPGDIVNCQISFFQKIDHVMRSNDEIRDFFIRESHDDADTMARYQIFEAVATMAFDFNREFITDESSIKDLIEKYNEFYVKEKSWGGGPPPRGFVEYFNKNYSKKGNASLSSWYPTLDLMIETPDYGTLIVGFSIINKTKKLYNWSSLKESDIKYDQSVVREIANIVKDMNKMTLDEVIDTFQLNVKNKIEWEWKS